MQVFKGQLHPEHDGPVLFDAVEDPEPHGGAQDLGAPAQVGGDVGGSNGTVTDVLGSRAGHGYSWWLKGGWY